MTEVYKGPLAAPILATQQERLYRTRIRNGVQFGEGVERVQGELERPGPNFAGHYIIVEIGCGSPCVLMAIVDAKTGRIHNPPMSTGLGITNLGGYPWLPGIEFRLDSDLMIMRPCANDGPVYDHYFLWTDNRWKLIRKVKQEPESVQPDRGR